MWLPEAHEDTDCNDEMFIWISMEIQNRFSDQTEKESWANKLTEYGLDSKIYVKMLVAYSWDTVSALYVA